MSLGEVRGPEVVVRAGSEEGARLSIVRALRYVRIYRGSSGDV